MSKRIFITGNLGFIFGHFTNYLLNNTNCVVFGYDAKTYAADKTLNHQWRTKFPNRYFYHIGLVQNYGDLEYCVEDFQPDLVIMAHAQSHVDNSIQNSTPFIESNIIGAWTALEICKKYKLPLLMISTDEVLEHKFPITHKTVSKSIDNPSSETIKLEKPIFYRAKERTLYDAGNPYSASKAAAEILLKAWKNTYGLKANIVRLTNIYGPRQHKEKLIPKTINNALHNEKIPVYGKGQQWRDYLYIDDAISGLILILEYLFKETSSGGIILPLAEILHISANDERQNIETVKTILKLMGKSEDLIKFVKDRPGHDYSYSLDSSLIRQMGWRPKIEFEDGLKRTIEYYART